MYELTKQLRQYAIDHLDVAEDAEEKDFRAAIDAALKAGTLSGSDFAKMITPEANEDLRKEMAKIIGEQVAEATAPIMDAVKELAATKPEPPPEPAPDPTPAKGATPEELAAAVKAAVDKEMASRDDTVPTRLNRLIAGSSAPRVKAAVEQYDSTTKELVCPMVTASGRRHPLAGQRATFMGRGLHQPSEQDLAIIGAVGKLHLYASRSFNDARLTEHDWGLLHWAFRNTRWTGMLGGPEGVPVDNRKLTEMEVKALIDDATSGGTYMVPTLLDEAVIQTPILEGELFPFVEVVNWPRGSSVAGFVFGHVTITSDHTEGVAVSLESTSGFTSHLDTSIFPVVAAIEIGLDWESDTPVNVGQVLTRDIGTGLKNWLDNQIANGDGTTEPTGIFNASGTTTVTHTGGTSSAFTLSDFEKLIHGLSKAYRTSKGGRCVFTMNDTTYRRARSTPVGTSDARRLLGMDHSAYQIMEYDAKIETNITDGTLAFWNPGYYRMFRRLGMQLRVVTEGSTLALANTRLIVMRARYGGQPTLGASVCKMTDGPQTG